MVCDPGPVTSWFLSRTLSLYGSHSGRHSSPSAFCAPLGGREGILGGRSLAGEAWLLPTLLVLKPQVPWVCPASLPFPAAWEGAEPGDPDLVPGREWPS